ncbi:MAG: hypothetical protein WC413_03025 [Candidatus Nanoarchaeia archaeon]
MKFKVIFGLLVISLFLISGCENIDINGISKNLTAEDVNKIIACETPYMRFETGCCLDQNNNKICDEDEGITSTPNSENLLDISGAVNKCNNYCMQEDYTTFLQNKLNVDINGDGKSDGLKTCTELKIVCTAIKNEETIVTEETTENKYAIDSNNMVTLRLGEGINHPISVDIGYAPKTTHLVYLIPDNYILFGLNMIKVISIDTNSITLQINSDPTFIVNEAKINEVNVIEKETNEGIFAFQYNGDLWIHRVTNPKGYPDYKGAIDESRIRY